MITTPLNCLSFCSTCLRWPHLRCCKVLIIQKSAQQLRLDPRRRPEHGPYLREDPVEHLQRRRQRGPALRRDDELLRQPLLQCTTERRRRALFRPNTICFPSNSTNCELLCDEPSHLLLQLPTRDDEDGVS